MAEKRVQFSNIVQNQLPQYVESDFPLVAEFLKSYYQGQEYTGGPIDLIQNIDQYTKLDETTKLNKTVGLATHITSYDKVIPIDMTQYPEGTSGFPDSYGLIKIDDEIITYTGIAKTAFTGCIRGFCGITSYSSEGDPEVVVFEDTKSGIHTTGASITNLSCIFLEEFLLKTKNQLLPGLENRALAKNLNKNVFIKQAKDFYLSKGTDRSFEILFKALYEEDVKIIRPRDFLFTPSNANYKVTNDLVVEPLLGDPEELENSTLYQDADKFDKNITYAHAPVTDVEKIVAVGAGQTFYKLSFDGGYNRDLRVDGSLYGDFSVHPKTKLIGEIGAGATTIDVDSTVGFSSTGELLTFYNTGAVGIISYTSKSLTQFYGCSNITGKILDKSNIGINTYAYAYSSSNPNKVIRVRVNSVLKSVKYDDNTSYYGINDIAKLKTLGIGDTSFKAKNWFYNIAPIYNIKSIELIDSSDFTYKVTLKVDHIFKSGDSAQIIDNSLVGKDTIIVNILDSRVFTIRGQGSLNISDNYTIKRNLLKVVSNSFPDASRFVTNIQNVYKEKYTDNLLVASPSIPSYDSQPIDTSDRSKTFSGTYEGEEFNIGKHTFYTGDAVYYIPQKVEEQYVQYGEIKTRMVVKSSLFVGDIGILTEDEIPSNEGLYFIKRVSSTVVKLAKSKADIYKSKFISIDTAVTVNDCIIQLYDFRFKTLDTQKLLRKISPSHDNSTVSETLPGFTGILINGVEVLNYKSKEIINYGKLTGVDILAPGSEYDIINPKPLFISDNVGTGATGYTAISGSLRKIRIIDPGFDYEETPIVTISGGNGTGAVASVNTKLIEHKVAFNAQDNAQEVGLGTTVSTIGFSTFHKFRNAEQVIYDTSGQEGISGLTTDASYFVSHVNNTTVRLHPSQEDAIVGVNTVVLLTGGVGRQYIKSYNKKRIIEGIDVITPGSGYQTKKRTTAPTGINTALNEITIENHGYEKGEILKYTSQGSVIGGLSDGSEYYVTKVDNDKFKLSTTESLCITEQYIDLTGVGVGTHVFNYQDISVKVVGKVGISSIGSETFEAQVQPIFRGQITSVHLQETGVGYGSSEIINFERLPDISLLSGSNAALEAIIHDGEITDILILNNGKDYTSTPDLDIVGDGVGAILTPIITNGQLTSVKIISGGTNYTSEETSIRVIEPGTNVKFKPNIQSWRINLFEKYFGSFTADDGFITKGLNTEYGLQYSYLYPPRKLRELVFSVDQSGEILYGNRDLKRNNGIEIDSTHHSPIIGWAYDGNPIYGPYGYSTNNGGVVTQMKSGYKEEAVKKNNRPPISIFGPGFFVEDFTYYDVSDETVLDENNGRFGITPEFPNGTYAYFATIDNTGVAQDGPFEKYKIPVFPYFLGDNYHSVPNDFNYQIGSNQDHVELNGSDWCRNTQPYNLIEGSLNYEYVSLPNDLSQTIKVKGVRPGNVTNVGIVTGGHSYRVGDPLVFNNTDTRGYGASVEVSRVFGQPINNISVASSTISDIKVYPSDTKGDYILIADNPHNFKNEDIITISGLSTTSSKIGGSYSAGISSNRLTLIGVGDTSSGIGSAEATGVVTYFNVSGNLSYPYIKENDVLGIGTEKLKVLNIDPRLSRIRVLREFDGTVGNGHTEGIYIYDDPRRIVIDAGFKTDYSPRIDKQLYFNPSESVGLGTSAGVGIGTTISFTNPGTGITDIFIQTQAIYIPNHGLKTGDKLTYSPNNGSGIVVLESSSAGISTLTDGQTLYAAAINDYLVGIATTAVGLGATGNFVGIASTTSTTLYFSGVGTGVYHSFKTNYSPITCEVNRQLVTVATSQTHGLTANDTVYVDVNPSVASTFVVTYNDYNRRVLVGVKTFTSAGVNSTTNAITITDHGFVTGEKIVHVADNADTPAGGLNNQGIYYIVKIDSNSFKLSDTYYNSIQPIPFTIELTDPYGGSIGPVNPPLNVYKDSSIIFDLSDSSLSYTNQSTQYSAFELNFYIDKDFIHKWDKDVNVKDFSVVRNGLVGIDADAKVTLTVNKNIPDILYYKLDPLYQSNIPVIKKEIVVDTEVVSGNEVLSTDSIYDGKQIITAPSTTSFTYTLNQPPERTSYASTTFGGPILTYETSSLSALGAITKFDILDAGRNYYEVPGITTIITSTGAGSEVKISSDNVGKITRTKIDNIGFDFASDTTLAPSVGLPQIAEMDPLTSIESIGITSVGRGYTSAPELLIFDGKTGSLVADIDLKYTLGESQVTILKNTYGIHDVTPTVLPVDNSNGVGISTVGFNTLTRDVTVTMAVGFSTINSFPFAVNDRVLIEGVSVGIGSTGIGYDSKNYDYKLFTLTAVEENLGGIGSVTYSLLNDLEEGTFPGAFDAINSSGRIIPEKYFPSFKVDLKSNDYLIGETVTSDSATGTVEYWNNKVGLLRISSNETFVTNEKIIGGTSKTQGIASTIRSFDSYSQVGPFSKVERGWETDSGILNKDIQRIQDSDYYQNFSYSLSSRVDYDTWYDVVSSLNHTLGFKKFSDYQLESHNNIPARVGLSTGLSSIDVINNLDGFANLNCVYGFDVITENALKLNGREISTEIMFANRILQDYMESFGNRVLSIDDVSSQFNSHPRPTAYSKVDSFVLADIRARKFITYVQDQRYTAQRQLMIVDLIHDGTHGYLNQYGRIETEYPQGSFDFRIVGTEGEVLFYPVRSTVNDYYITALSYNLDDNILSTGSTSIGGLVIIDTESTSVSSGTTATIVSIASTYSSAKVLITINPDISGNDNEFEFTEFNIVHNDVDVELMEYGKLTTNLGSYVASGLGTFNAYIDSSLLKVDFAPNSGIGTTAAVNAITVGLANSTFSGIGTVQFKHTRLEAKTTSISSSGSPTENVICEYENDYDAAYFIVQVCDKTNKEYQLSEFAIVDNYDSSDGSGDSYDVEWGNVETSVGLGTLGSRVVGASAGVAATVELLFTPTAGIDVEVNVFMNALKNQDDAQQEISFNNGSIRSGFGEYTGTDSDIMRAFNLTHKTYPIFERYFTGNDSDIVSVANNTITIPNHFYVSGEKIRYKHVGTAASAIAITAATFPGVGSTEYLPEDLFVVKINDDTIKIATSAENALKVVPEVVDITSVGIGTSHRFVATNQNAKVMNALDNLIQSPVVSTAVTNTLADQVYTTDNILYFSGITSFFGGDLIKIGSEIMKIEGIGIASTNAIRVRRPWMGTVLAGYGTGDLITKVDGDYNIVDNVLNYVAAPHGNRPIGSTTNPPDDRDWTGISTSSTFQGRVFMKNGVTGTSTDAYSKNYVFDDISKDFNGINNEFNLKSNGENITGITTEGVILINDIWQGRPVNFSLSEAAGVTTVTFQGVSTSNIGYDVGISSYPVGGMILSVGSEEGLGYQPLVAAGGTATVSTAGTVSSISIGYSGSGYRSGIGQTVNISIQQENLSGTDIVAIGTATIGSDGYLTGVAVTNPHVFYKPRSVANVGYNSITGMSTVTSLTAHGLSVGDEVVLSGIAFTCTYSGPKSITGFAYSAASGIVTVTTSGSHGYSAGQDVIFTGIAMTCGLDAGASTHYYPRGEDPAYNTAISIASTTGTTITVNVGYGAPTDQFAHTFVSATSGAVISGGDYAHQFVSAASSAVISGGDYTHTFVSVGVGTITVTGIGSTTPTDATYTPSTGELVLTISGHSYTTSDTVGIGTSALVFTCSMDNNATEKNYPRSTDPIIGVNTAITATTDDTITVNVGASPLVYFDVTNATYDGNAGVSTLTIGSHSLTTSTSVRLADNALTFRCAMDDYASLHTYPRSTDPGFSTSINISSTTSNTITLDVGASPLVTHNVSAADYSANVGVMTMTIGAHTLKTGESIKLATESLSFTCTKDSGVTTHRYPRKPDPAYTGSTITSATATQFVTNIGISTVETFYKSGGTVQGAIIAPRAVNNSLSKTDPAYGQATVTAVLNDNKFMVQTGISTRSHFYARGGKINKPMKVIFDDPLSYSNMPLIYSSSSAVGVGTSGVVDIQVGQGSSIIDFEIRNTGYGFGNGDILTIPIGGPTGIPTSSGFSEFTLTVDNVFTDKFSGWSLGQLQTLDNVESYIDGERVDFPLMVAGESVSILARKGSKINVQDVLLVFVNDILQVPGEGYEFNGGSILTFTEPLKLGDSVKLSFYKGNGDSDVLSREVLETVKIGDELTVGYDPANGQAYYLQEDPRTVTSVNSTELVNTNPYYGPGNTGDSTLLRPVAWCRQTEDKIINEKIVGKNREWYEANINPVAYIIKSVGIGSTAIYVDNVRPFFDSQNENDTSISFQNKIDFVRQETKASAAATAVVSGIGSISSIVISDGGVGYTTAFVSIASTVGIGTTTQAFGSVTIGAAGTVTGVAITSPGVGYTNTSAPKVLISPPLSTAEANTVDAYSGDSGVIVGVGTTTDSSQPQLIFDLFIPFDSDLRNTTLTGTAITLSSLDVNDYFMVFESNTGAGSTSITSLDPAGSVTVGIGTSFVDNIYAVQNAESVERSISGVTTYVRRVFVNTQNLITYGSGISTSDYFGEFSWGRITLPSRTGIASYTAYTLSGIGTATSGVSTSMMVQRSASLKTKNYSV